MILILGVLEEGVCHTPWIFHKKRIGEMESCPMESSLVTVERIGFGGKRSGALRLVGEWFLELEREGVLVTEVSMGEGDMLALTGDPEYLSVGLVLGDGRLALWSAELKLDLSLRVVRLSGKAVK
jgi:hypothetical protein